MGDFTGDFIRNLMRGQAELARMGAEFDAGRKPKAEPLIVWVPVTIAGDAEIPNVMCHQHHRWVRPRVVTLRLDLNDDDGPVTWADGAPGDIQKRERIVWNAGGDVLFWAARLDDSKEYAALRKRVLADPEDYCEDEAQGVRLAEAARAERQS